MDLRRYKVGDKRGRENTLQILELKELVRYPSTRFPVPKPMLSTKL